MENFEASQYRENLAKEIKQERDKDKRREILEQARGTEEYKAAKSETVAIRRQKIEEQQAIKKHREKLRGGETKETILNGVEAFTSEVLEKYPQVSDDGKLNYYLSGSLSVMLLLKCGSFEVIDETRLPEIVPLAEKEVPPEAAKHLEGFVRKIGDLDFVPLEEWKKSDKRMKKGGGELKMAELSEAAKKALEISENQLAVKRDPLETVTPHRVARVKINDKEVYITEPRMMLAYKTVHLGQAFEKAGKAEKFVSDFNAMLKGLEAIYSREELLQAAHETMLAYAPNSPNNTFVPYHNPKFRGELRKFYDEAIALDADASYLDRLQYGKERSVGVLKVLHCYQSPEAKQAIVDFFNRHKEQIDRWSVNSTSTKNREVIADFLLSRPELLDEFKTHFQGEPTRDAIVEALKTHVWAFDKYGSQMDDRSALEMSPMISSVMDLLMKINESNINQELRDVGDLLDNGMNALHLDKILGAKFAADVATRQKLFDGLKTARATLSDQEFEHFTLLLSIAVANTRYYDSEADNFVEIKEEERPERIGSVFGQFGLKYNRN